MNGLPLALFELKNPWSNIIVIADEAHRSQYGFLKGYARYLAEALPNARRIGFTGTPISFSGADTVEVFGDLIHTYDIQQSQEDHATVPIHYEPRQVRLHLTHQDVDAALDDILQDDAVDARDRGRRAALAAAAGARDRLEQLAKDLLSHFQQRTATLEGKALKHLDECRPFADEVIFYQRMRAQVLQTFKDRPLPNLRLKLLERLLRDEIESRRKRNLAQAKSFRELLEATLQRYHARLIDAAVVIKAMLEIKRDMDATDQRAAELGLAQDELAFYDAVAVSREQVYDVAFLRDLVHDVVQTIKRKLKVGWTEPHRDDVKSEVRAAVRRVLLRRGVRAEDFEPLLKAVMDQAEALFGGWPTAA